jgi:hypothetical protein
MTVFHPELVDRWSTFSIYEQMANIGAEVGRANNWKKKKNATMSLSAFYRALELIDFSVADPKNKNSLKELLYLREVLCDYLVGTNIYKSTDESWDKYFFPFNYAARYRSDA